MNVAQAHLIVNHAPMYALLFALLLLVWATLGRSRALRVAAYAVFLLAGIAAVVAFVTGVNAVNAVIALPGISPAAIERHQEAALYGVVLLCLTGVFALVGFIAERSASILRPIVIAVLLVGGLAAVGVIGYAASLGGTIHHPEITARK